MLLKKKSVGDLGPVVMVYPTCPVIITCLCGRGAGPEGIKQEPAYADAECAFKHAVVQSHLSSSYAIQPLAGKRGTPAPFAFPFHRDGYHFT